MEPNQAIGKSFCKKHDESFQDLAEPTPDQIQNSSWLGWSYAGDGYFIKGDAMGHYEGGCFVVDD